MNHFEEGVPALEAFAIAIMIVGGAILLLSGFIMIQQPVINTLFAASIITAGGMILGASLDHLYFFRQWRRTK